MELLWFAHVWSPDAPSCQPAAIAAASEILGVETAYASVDELVESRAAWARDSEYTLRTLRGALQAYGGVMLVETRTDWIVVGVHDPTRQDPWFVSDCREPEARWMTTDELRERRSPDLRVVWLYPHRGLPETPQTLVVSRPRERFLL